MSEVKKSQVRVLKSNFLKTYEKVKDIIRKEKRMIYAFYDIVASNNEIALLIYENERWWVSQYSTDNDATIKLANILNSIRTLSVHRNYTNNTNITFPREER